MLLDVGGLVAAVAVAAAAFALTRSGNDDETPAGGESTATATAPAAAQVNTPAPTWTAAAAVTPAPTATPAPSAAIKGITVSNGRYWVEFTTTALALNGVEGVTHVHFFWDTVPVSAAGVPGAGPWIVYGGPSPFTGYSVSEKPAAAKQMCVLVANADHSVRPGTGNCFNLP